MKCLSTKLVLAILAVFMVIGCNNEKTVNSPIKLNKEDPNLYGLPLWLEWQQAKAENGREITDINESFSVILNEYLSNLDYLCIYWNSNANSLTQEELIQYISDVDNFEVLQAFEFDNSVEKETIYVIHPISYPFSVDRLYLNFVTTYFPAGESITGVLQIFTGEPYLLKAFLGENQGFLFKETSPINTAVKPCDYVGQPELLYPYYYQKIIEFALPLEFSGKVVLQFLSDALLNAVMDYHGYEAISEVIDKLATFNGIPGFFQFIAWLRDAVPDSLKNVIDNLLSISSDEDIGRNAYLRSQALIPCMVQDEHFLYFLCTGNLPTPYVLT